MVDIGCDLIELDKKYYNTIEIPPPLVLKKRKRGRPKKSAKPLISAKINEFNIPSLEIDNPFCDSVTLDLDNAEINEDSLLDNSNDSVSPTIVQSQSADNLLVPIERNSKLVYPCPQYSKIFKDASTHLITLDKKYYNTIGIPPPLVLKNWIADIETEVEDNITLALVSAKLKSENNVVRKRGRPKKSTEPLISAIIEEFNIPSPEIDNAFCDNDTLDQDNAEVNDDSQLNNDIDSASPTIGQSQEPDEDTLLVIVPIEKNSKLVYPCPQCPKIFKAASTLKYHFRIHSGNLLKCIECNKEFTTKYLLKCHLRLHTGELFICEICSKGFTTAELLKIHRRKHTGERPFECNQCHKKFPSSSNLKQHKETHLEEKKYLCSTCGASFNQKRCLECHMLVHSEKTHTCAVCGKQWARKSDLVEHMRVHSREKPFECKICYHRFTQASSLKRHSQAHQKSEPITCKYCSKSFHNKLSYQRHLRKHGVVSEET